MEQGLMPGYSGEQERLFLDLLHHCGDSKFGLPLLSHYWLLVLQFHSFCSVPGLGISLSFWSPSFLMALSVYLTYQFFRKGLTGLAGHIQQRPSPVCRELVLGRIRDSAPYTAGPSRRRLWGGRIQDFPGVVRVHGLHALLGLLLSWVSN